MQHIQNDKMYKMYRNRGEHKGYHLSPFINTGDPEEIREGREAAKKCRSYFSINCISVPVQKSSVGKLNIMIFAYLTIETDRNLP